MYTQRYHILDKYNSSNLISYSSLEIDTDKKVWLTEHQHTDLELGLYLKGSGSYSVCGKQLDFTAGDFLVFGSNQQHTIHSITKGENLVIINLHFNPYFLLEYINISSNQNYFYLLTILLKKNALIITKTDPYYSSMYSLLFEIENEFKLKKPEYALVIKNKLTDILIMIIRSYENEILSLCKQNIKMEHFLYLNKIEQYITNNLTNPLTLSSIAEEVHLSRTYLCAIFKEIKGITLWDYITSKRINLSLYYLQETDKSISIVSELCGFSSVANFYRAFHKITNHSPYAYREHKTNSY